MANWILSLPQQFLDLPALWQGVAITVGLFVLVRFGHVSVPIILFAGAVVIWFCGGNEVLGQVGLAVWQSDIGKWLVLAAVLAVGVLTAVFWGVERFVAALSHLARKVIRRLRQMPDLRRLFQRLVRSMHR